MWGFPRKTSLVSCVPLFNSTPPILHAFKCLLNQICQQVGRDKLRRLGERLKASSLKQRHRAHAYRVALAKPKTCGAPTPPPPPPPRLKMPHQSELEAEAEIPKAPPKKNPQTHSSSGQCRPPASRSPFSCMETPACLGLPPRRGGALGPLAQALAPVNVSNLGV